MTAERHWGRPGSFATRNRQESPAWKRAGMFVGAMALVAAAVTGLALTIEFTLPALILELAAEAKQ